MRPSSLTWGTRTTWRSRSRGLDHVGTWSSFGCMLLHDDEVGDDEPLGSASCTLTQVRLAGSDRLELPVLSPDHQQGIVGISLRWTPTGAFSNAAVYGYGEPEVLAGGGQYSRVAPSGAPPPPYYGVDSLQVEEVVMERERRGEYPHRRHHHQEQETEERW
ncbi:hypothetical protein Vafri_21698 [Volvox africanus]|uniref:Uncharacterized protein n=1 Tax=Volvox africanus TaxID=51714 RepID=A0A8J4BW55_9CHLO|nr:hypothetical protein Vafri_21698 [Volvox africanus]